MRALALACISLGVLCASARYGSFVAGGSDSYCYVHQAERWASGRLQVPEPLALEAPWPEAALSFAPAGHLPSSTMPGAIVPVCPSGLSIVMAVLLFAGGRTAMFFVVPLLGVLLIWATYAVGARFGARIGLASALVVACSPIFLYQVVQPMSDVPAAALWMTALACATGVKPRHPVAAGLCASGAILVRPNLLPLGIVIGLFLLCRSERTWRTRVRDSLVYAAWCVPGCLAVAATQQYFYGSPFSSGYGGLGELFGLDNVMRNASKYASWLVQAQTPLIVLAAAAPVLLPGALTWLCVASFLVNLGLYLPYVVFDDWSYLRFVLPTLPLLVVLLMAVMDAIGRRIGLKNTAPLLALAAVALAMVTLREARDRNTFRLQQLEARFERAGEFVDRRLPSNALVITSWHSGSVRFYSARKTLVWDGLDPAWLDRAIAFVHAKGFEPYVLIERWEEPRFRSRFQGSRVAELDWPPMAEIASQVRIYEPDDRARYVLGESVLTEYAP